MKSAAAPIPGTAARALGSDGVAGLDVMTKENEQLGRNINQHIWNERRYEKIPEYYTADFVSDYSPRIVRKGRDQIVDAVNSAHDTFEGFRETINQVIADESRIVLHFTITGRQVKDWGPVPATGKRVKYDEIVIMNVRDGKVCRQTGVLDTLLALQQLGRIPDPTGVVEKSLASDD